MAKSYEIPHSEGKNIGTLFLKNKQLQINMRPKAETLALKCNLTNKRQNSFVGLGFSWFVSDTYKIRKFLIVLMEV